MCKTEQLEREKHCIKTQPLNISCSLMCSMYKNWKNFKKHHQLAISLIILSGIICFWWGITGLLDLYLLPELPFASKLVSMVIGIVILTLTHYSVEKIV